VITGGANTSCVTYTAGNGGTECTFRLIVTSENGCKDTCSVKFGCQNNQYFCTLTQGAYGNANGMFAGMRRLQLINTLLSEGELIIGKTTAQASPLVLARSVRFDINDAQCIINLMPAGGTPGVLPSNLGNLDMVDCGTGTLPVKNGRFFNNFIGQLLALSLNARPGDDNALAGMKICATMKSYRAIIGPDGKPMQDPTDLTGRLVSISPRVIAALEHLSLPKTVTGLIELANRSIAGQFTDVATLADIHGACGAINEGFDECRFLGQCLDAAAPVVVGGGNGEVIDESPVLPREFSISASAPNPFNHTTTLRLSLPERSRVQLSVYNILGQEVARLADGEFGAGTATLQWNASSRHGEPVAPGVYFFRVKANSLESSRSLVRTQKVLYIR